MSHQSIRSSGEVFKASAKGCSILAGISMASLLISTGGGERERRRLMQVSRMAMWMAEHGFYTEETPGAKVVFIPSARWRSIAPGILSTSRFVGMLVGCGQRLAVYDIGDGHMDWQVRAENSLFQCRYVFHNTQYMVSADKLRPYAACIYCAGFIKVIYYIYDKFSMPVDM